MKTSTTSTDALAPIRAERSSGRPGAPHAPAAPKLALSTLALAVAALLAVGSLALAQDDAAVAQEQVEALQGEIDRLEEQVASLEEAVVASNLLLADRYLTAAGFHAMDQALNEGELDPRYLQATQTTLVALDALYWPDELQEARRAFVAAAEALVAALQQEDLDAAAEAGARVHAREHDLSHAIFAYLAPAGTDDGHAGDGHAPGGTGDETAGDGAAVVPEGAQEFVLAIAENGAPIGGVLTHRVQRGDVVALSIRSEVAGDLHLHGYDAEWALHGGEVVVTFPATATGRFPLEFHPEGSERGVVVAYLEVHP